MQKKFTSLSAILICLLFLNGDLFAQNLCSSATTSKLTNSPTSITLTDLGATPSSGTYTVTLAYLDPSTNIPVPPISPTVSVSSSGTTCVISLAVGVDLASNSDVTLTLSNGVNYYYSGWNYGQCKSLIPITLSSFTATSQTSGYNLLSWTTSQESNSSHFIIQRSTDGFNFSNYGIEPAAGYSGVSLTYNFYAAGTPRNVKHYYRLQMIDLNGTYKYSDVKIVTGGFGAVVNNFCNYTSIEGNSSICGTTNVFKVHNASPNVSWSISSGTVSVSNGGAVASLSGCLTANATITATSDCPKSKSLYVCTPSVDAVNFCSSGSASLVNAPSGAAVTWSAYPAGIVTFGCASCTTTSLSRVIDGDVTLTATPANSCAQPASKTITVGNTNNLTGTYTTNSGTKPMYTVNSAPVGSVYGSFSWPGVTNISATLGAGSASGTGFYSYGNSFSFNLSAYQSVNISFTGNGSCGGQVTATRTFAQYSSYSYALSASPNPAKSTINLKIKKVAETPKLSAPANAEDAAEFSNGATTKEFTDVAATANSAAGKPITRVFLYDFNTNKLVKQWSFQEADLMQYSLNIAGIKKGVYILQMERNNKTTTTKIIVE